MGLAVRRSAVQQTPEIVRGFLKAFLPGVRVAIEQPDLSKRAAAKYFATKDTEIIEEGYKGFAPLFPEGSLCHRGRDAFGVLGHGPSQDDNRGPKNVL